MKNHESRLWRLERLEAESDPWTAWERTEGLAALLDAARRLPQRDPWDAGGVEDGDLEDSGSMGQLLREARREARERGA
jgi:hypothetical protein